MCGVASKFGHGSDRGDPDVSISLEQTFGMDRGYVVAFEFRVWIGALFSASQPHLQIHTYMYIYVYIYILYKYRSYLHV